MVLKIEILNYALNRWVLINNLYPNDIPGSITDVRGNERQVYIFECGKDDSNSTIYRSRAGVDIANAQTRVITSAEMEVVRVLRANESHVLQIKTDVSPEERKIRFTHL